MKAKELCNLAVEWLKTEYPDAVIVTELSVADWGGARIDVAAITDNEIIGVEIKGEGDSHTRLKLQGLVYGRVARQMWLLPCDSLLEKCKSHRPVGWGLLEVYEEDGQVRPYNWATKHGKKVKTKHGYTWEQLRDDSRYDPYDPPHSKHLCPHSMCGTLWRDELYQIARLSGVQINGRALVHTLTDAICDQLPAPTIHTLMIRELRRRIWKKTVIDLRENGPANKQKALEI